MKRVEVKNNINKLSTESQLYLSYCLWAIKGYMINTKRVKQ